MSASCSHTKHRTGEVPYAVPQRQKIFVSVDQGWNGIHNRWELCDNGLFQSKKQVKTRRHPHSIPRDSKYRAKRKPTSENEMS